MRDWYGNEGYSYLKRTKIGTRVVDYQEIDAWYEDTFDEGWLESAGGGRVRYAFQTSLSSKAIVVVVPGRTECIEKYRELCWDLRSCNYDILVYDHLGQGKSHRLLDDRQKGHIERFEHYVTDLDNLFTSIVSSFTNGPIYLLTHSMGATIAALLVQQNSLPVDGLIMLSPMLQISSDRLLHPKVAEIICSLVCTAGGRQRYVWGGGPFNPQMSFKSNPLTTDPVRFRHNRNLFAAQPELSLGSPTFGWLQEAFRGMRAAREQAALLACPTLIVRSLNDRVVGLPAINRFSADLTQATVLSFGNCQHELLMERDEIRSDLVQQIIAFINQ